MTTDGVMPPPVPCPNPSCRSPRATGDRYCGACGAALQPDIAQLVKWAVAEQTKDREVLQVETARAVAEMVWGWGKTFVGVAGLSTAFLVLALAILGYRSVADINQSQKEAVKAADEARASIKEREADLTRRMGELDGRRKDSVSQFDKADAELAGLAERVKRQKGELAKFEDDLRQLENEFRARLDSAEYEVAGLQTTVGELEDRFVGKALPPPHAARLVGKLAPFRGYLKALGLRGTEADLPIHQGGPGAGAQILYLATKPTIVVGSQFLASEAFLDAPDAVAREFAHHVLYASLPADWKPGEAIASVPLGPLESGFADYLVASWTNTPSLYRAAAAALKGQAGFDKDEIRNLANDRSLKALPEAVQQTAGEVWGAVFWDLRRELGQPVADKLLADAWMSIRPADIKADPLAQAAWLRDRFVELAKPIDGGRHVTTIRTVFDRRGLRP